MAESGLLLDKDQFNCTICLDVLKDPVTIPCGHSYCSGCISHYWDQNDYMGLYSCPQCRQAFNPRPVLGRNTMLTDVVERFKKTSLGSACGSSPLGPEDVACDVCTGTKNRAVRSCLVCLASYCQNHVQPHYDSPAFKKHKLVPASRKLQERICPEHDKLLEFFCRSDQTCVCYLCLTSDHKAHDTVLAETEIQDRQAQLAEQQKSSQRQILGKEKEVQGLRQAIASLRRSARAAEDDCERSFSELIRSLELKRFELRELLRAQEKMAVSRAEQQLAQLEQEVVQLRGRDAQLEQLTHTDDHITFLQSCKSLWLAPGPEGLPAVKFDPNFTFGSVMAAVSEFRALLDEVCHGGFLSIYDKVRDVAIVVSPKSNITTAQENVATGFAQENVATGTSPQNVATGNAQQTVDLTTENAQQSESTPAPPATDLSTPCLNPFISGGVPTQPFVTGFGFKYAKPSGSASKHRSLQRRSHSRRK